MNGNQTKKGKYFCLLSVRIRPSPPHTYACHYPHIRVFSWSHMCSKKIVLFAMNLASSFEDKLKQLERCWHRSIYPVLVSRRRVVHKSKEKLWQTREVSCRRVTACYSCYSTYRFQNKGSQALTTHASQYDTRLPVNPYLLVSCFLDSFYVGPFQKEG